jgi:aarF domain-containing kinase
MIGIDYLSAGENITSEVHQTAATRLFHCFCKNGGPYIKLGQMVGQLQQLIPDEYCKTFEPMCNKAPTTCYADVKLTIEEEYGQPIHEIFSEFEE